MELYEEIEVISMEDEKLHTRENGCVDSNHHPVRSKAEDEPGVGDECPLIYKISDRPPAHLIFFFGFQQAVISIAHQLVVSLLVAEVVCASNDSALNARLLSSTLFMTGFTTLLMVTIGSRLPLFQGAAIEYLSPLLMLGAVDSTFCATDTKHACVNSANQAVMNASLSNTTALMTSLFNVTSISDYERSINAITSLQGSLMVAGALHTFVGFTGLVGVMLRFVGPMTIIPAVLLIGLYMIKGTAKFVFVNWIVAVITASVTMFLSLYLGRKKTPIPSWSRAKGFHIVWYPLHQVFSILIGMIVGTVVCAFFTAYNVVPNDPCNPHFRTRTDARIEALEKADWFTFPYPGQFGAISFSSNALVGCLLATVLSILDSVDNYFACTTT
ncbi:hypothetical protein DPMN_167210 [Dreissena polymorpha]|uniref:Uncharacterized protein n=1 Tax=Dreissena polymorpha TaxID=45954 RepID=A0A9D4F0Z6_DREPO|nr:hypothetical protein DPMN_167210 [Dreissena polymorpha]